VSLNHPNIAQIYGFEKAKALVRWSWSSSKGPRSRTASHRGCPSMRPYRLPNRLAKRAWASANVAGAITHQPFVVFAARRSAPRSVRGADADALLAGLSNHLHGFDLYYRRAYHVRFACSSIFRWRCTWLLHRSRHFHLFVDVGRPFGLR
jgi:hypothetical protein